jgi:hypothetical protein
MISRLTLTAASNRSSLILRASGTSFAVSVTSSHSASVVVGGSRSSARAWSRRATKTCDRGRGKNTHGARAVAASPTPRFWNLPRVRLLAYRRGGVSRGSREKRKIWRSGSCCGGSAPFQHRRDQIRLLVRKDRSKRWKRHRRWRQPYGPRHPRLREPAHDGPVHAWWGRFFRENKNLQIPALR